MRKSSRFLVGVSVSCLLIAFLAPHQLAAQNLGDYYTAGFSNARTGANAQMGDFRPPLKLVRSIPLSGIDHPALLMAFEDSLLVGESGTRVRYHLLDRQSGEERWEQDLAGGDIFFHYVPAYSDDVVFLAGATTTEAVRVSTGEVLWRDESIGDVSGRYPLISGDVVVYSGVNRLVAAGLETGAVLWQHDVTTAPYSLCSYQDLVYWLDGNDIAHAVRLETGEESWHGEPLPGAPPEPEYSYFSDVVASGKYLFVSVIRDMMPGWQFFIRALDARDGHEYWSRAGNATGKGGLLLAYDRLYEVGGSGLLGHLYASDPADGAVLWDREEIGPFYRPNPVFTSDMFHTEIANNALYYFNGDWNRIMVRDAFTGNALWSISTDEDEVTDLCLANGRLLALFEDRIDIYEPTHEIFFAHIADGGGQTTILTLTNASSHPATGRVRFFDDRGEPFLPVATTAQAGDDLSLPLSIPARSSIAVATAGGPAVRSGWARVESDQPVGGTAIFQYSAGEIQTEAGVADALAATDVSVYVSRHGDLDTAIAIAVPVNAGTNVTYRLLDADGRELARNWTSLSAGGHWAGFIDDLYLPAIGEDVEGTLEIESELPIVVTALRTKKGVQQSSYPVISSAP